MNLRLSLIIAVVLLLCIPAITFAQSKDIAAAEYWQVIYSQYTSSRKVFPRKERDIYERFTDSKITYSRTKRFEYQSANTFRLVTETSTDGKISLTEMIQIGRVGYCKEDLGDWKTAGCYLNPPAALEDAVETRYFVQKNRDNTVYSRIATFLLKETGKPEQTKFLTVDTLTLNKDLSIRGRTIVKSFFETKNIASRETEQFKYSSTLKPIEAPIK